MSNWEEPEKIDVKKMLGNPKITFVIGAPGCGKGTQCEKLVEEFGYTHISTGDLMRIEAKKGTKEGEQIRKRMKDGLLVPYETTVQVLINALIANPSQNYLIDGFPRAVDQANHFEQNVCEVQNVLYFDCPEEECIRRVLERGKNSGREDDNQDTVSKRLTAYKESTIPVLDLYERFGKVKRIDTNCDELEAYQMTRKAMLPQISCIIGPKASGKTTLGNALCERTNMKLVNFNDFCAENKLEGEDDETVTSALIKQMSKELAPRILLEDFPQTEFQAKFFIKNCVTPNAVFSLKCSKDICQERMIGLDQNDPNYQASTILSKRIRIYNENWQKLMPFLQAQTNLKVVNTEQIFQTAFEELCSHVEPTIIHVRAGGGGNSQMNAKNIKSALISEQGYFELNLQILLRDEMERKTEIGKELSAINAGGKYITEDLKTRLLKKVIYSGNDKTKFMLVNFPETNTESSNFEAQCAKIAAIVYAAGEEPVVEILGDQLEVCSIDTLFQKEFRLKTMKGWDATNFSEQMGKKTDWSILLGRKYSGSEQLGSLISELTSGKIINMENIEKDITKKRLYPEEEAEAETDPIPVAEVEKDVLAIIEADKAAGRMFNYIFDNYKHETVRAFIEFTTSNLGSPSSIILADCEKKEIEARYKKETEVEEIGEEAAEELKQQGEAFDKQKTEFSESLEGTSCQQHVFDTAQSKESLSAAVRNAFCAKIILVNHESRLPVDTACANLAIKYGMLYLSVHQLIKKEIEADTALGQALSASRSQKSLNSAKEDEFDEYKYSAVHFKSGLVMQLVQKTIAANRTTQKFILLEGLINSNKLESTEEQLELRFMDEFFAIEKNIGEVNAVISMQFVKEDTQFIDDKFEEFEKEEAKVEEEKKEGEEGQEEDPPAAQEGEEGEEKKEVFDPSKYKWSITNGRSKNLPQLFRDYKGINCHQEEKKMDTVTPVKEQIVKAMEEFCKEVIKEDNTRNIYQQVIFNVEKL